MRCCNPSPTRCVRASRCAGACTRTSTRCCTRRVPTRSSPARCWRWKAPGWWPWAAPIRTASTRAWARCSCACGERRSRSRCGASMADRRPAAGRARERAPPRPPADLPPPFADYLAHLQVERRASPHTLANYRRDLEALVAWAAEAGVDAAAPAEADVRAFVASGHRRGLSPRSLQRRLSAVRGFYRGRLRHGHLAANPAAGVRAPKAPRKLPQVLDPDE